MSRDELRAHLNRPCPPGSWRDFLEPEVLDQRNWEEFELGRVEVEKGCPFDERLPPVRPNCEYEGLEHDLVESRAGAPVTEFEVCRRCGKIGARL